jgi:hypothetical protein
MGNLITITLPNGNTIKVPFGAPLKVSYSETGIAVLTETEQNETIYFNDTPLSIAPGCWLILAEGLFKFPLSVTHAVDAAGTQTAYHDSGTTFRTREWTTLTFDTEQHDLSGLHDG